MGNCNDFFGWVDGIIGIDLLGCIEFGFWSIRYDCRFFIFVILNVFCIVFWVRYMVYVVFGYIY